MFLAGFGTYLVSKEIYVLEHEFYCGVALFGKFRRLLLFGVKRNLRYHCCTDSWK